MFDNLVQRKKLKCSNVQTHIIKKVNDEMQKKLTDPKERCQRAKGMVKLLFYHMNRRT